MINEQLVRDVVDQTQVFDIHTHLYLPSFGLTLWGIDELLTYHYLVAEVMRFSKTGPDEFFAMPKRNQADHIWEHLFLQNTPVSEATTGVLTVLQSLGLDPNAKDLCEARAYFDAVAPEEHFDRVFDLSGVKSVVMTNDPFDKKEAPLWGAAKGDSRFLAALRVDPILNGWPEVDGPLMWNGYEVTSELGNRAIEELQRFLRDWIGKMNPRYVAVSLPPAFDFPEESARNKVLTKALLPVCEENGLPFAMMIGVRKRVNPRLGDAGDSVGLSDMGGVERLCAAYPNNKFLVTVLARENQQGLCVAARKFSNLLPFGCWWFMNNPSMVEEVTTMRLETLGTSFVPQHSDARVLDQLIYKWRHSKRDISTSLWRRYEALERAGRVVLQTDVERDAQLLLHDNAANWIGA